MTISAENAIQSDASEQLENQTSGADDNSGSEVQLSPRMAAMEAIAAGRRNELAAEGVDIGGMGEPVQAVATKPADDTAGEGSDVDQLAAQLGEDDRPSNVATDTMRVKVKVDGEEMELPLSEVVKSYQKDQTASRRLQEATGLLALAKQQASKLAQIDESGNNQPQHQETNEPISKADRQSQIKDVLSKLYSGDEEGAAEGLLSLIEAGAPAATQQAPIDPVAIVSLVKQQLEVESAYGEVKSDYPSIFSDDERGVVLGKAAYDRMTAKEAQGLSRSQALRESTEEVAALFGIDKSGRQQAEPSRTARDTKLERKANLDVPGAANVVAGNPQAHAEAPNVSSVIQEMARSRLGQSMNTGK